jgi:hypothetical protein
MLQTTVTHYAPAHDPAAAAACGAQLAHAGQASQTPSCAACAAHLALEARIDAEVEAITFSDDEATASILAFATQFTRVYARAVTADSRRGRRIGGGR